jgi:hypothetical protein
MADFLRVATIFISLGIIRRVRPLIDENGGGAGVRQRIRQRARRPK